MTARILDIVDNTIVDGPGLRVSVYFAGCKHYCPGCHNPESWDMAGGKEYDIDEIVKTILDTGKKKVTLSGGDPLYQSAAVEELCKKLKEQLPGVNIWLYTGFTGEELLENAYNIPHTEEDIIRYRLIVNYIDTLIDGPFKIEQKDEGLQFKGSSNQKTIQVNSPLVRMIRKNTAMKHYIKGDADLKYIQEFEDEYKPVHVADIEVSDVSHQEVH